MTLHSGYLPFNGYLPRTNRIFTRIFTPDIYPGQPGYLPRIFTRIFTPDTPDIYPRHPGYLPQIFTPDIYPGYLPRTFTPDIYPGPPGYLPQIFTPDIHPGYLPEYLPRTPRIFTPDIYPNIYPGHPGYFTVKDQTTICSMVHRFKTSTAILTVRDGAEDRYGPLLKKTQAKKIRRGKFIF